MDTQVPITSQASQQQPSVTQSPDVAPDPNDRYGVFHSFTDPKPNEANMQGQVPSVSIDQLPADPTDKYSIFRSFEGTIQTLSNQPVQSHVPGPDLLVSAAPMTGSSLMTDSQTVVASASGSPLSGMVDIPQQQVDHDFGAFSDFQSAPAPAPAPAPSVPVAQFQSSVQEGGFADFHMFTGSLTEVLPQSQASSDSGFTAFQSTVPVILPELHSQSQSSGDSGFLAFQSSVPLVIHQPEVPNDSGFSDFQAATPVVHPEIQSQSHVINGGQLSDVTATVSIHQEQPVLNQVRSGGDFASFQQPSVVIPPSGPFSSNVPDDSCTVMTSQSSELSDCKTLLALAMDTQPDESHSPVVAVSAETPIGLKPGTDLLGEDGSLVESVSQPVGKPSAEDDSFGEFSGTAMPPSKSELQVLRTGSGGFSASSSSSSLSKMNILSGNWSDLASLADLGVSTKPIKKESDEPSLRQTASGDLGQTKTKVTFQTGGDISTSSRDVQSNQPGNQTNSYLTEVVKLNWTSNEQSVIHPEPIRFGSRYERLDSAEAVCV